MRLHSFFADYKSLLSSEIFFSKKTPLTCLIGLNGSGKTNILQGITMAGACIRGDFQDQLRLNKWDINHLSPTGIDATGPYSSSFTGSKSLKFSVCCSNEDQLIEWVTVFYFDEPIRNSEELTITDKNGKKTVFSVEDNTIEFDKKNTKILFNYQGSILSALKDDFFASVPLVLEFKKFISSFHFFNVLNPQSLREPSASAENIGRSGADLAAFYHRLRANSIRKIVNEMRAFYPWLVDIKVHEDPHGFDHLIFIEKNTHSEREIPARYINDGTLRLLAILAELYSDASVILLDEIENGFNPAIIERLMKIVMSTDKQVVMTTHSPDILQYIPDDDADDVIRLIYRSKSGESKNLNFLEIPGVEQRLGVLSPGETFLDINLAEAIEQFEENPEEEKA